ncbi:MULTISPECIES: ATP cone domain-containing protein [Methanobacterium]|jgi:transcriptional regulator NrdR family protein|uniref:ATP cone domain-containing protein n=1 Tax=Methanobacterium veterum TaxID=408577 RepID=A0A9E5DH33_9EURY|nr:MULTISPECIES: ATP cone domain-containing protein [Methanobacterium]MCZ3365246.1 ATP cone domain-containing protein [Methanobacterium veterum]MCZ3373001.1 ATP cone domain-containing protein [Methanobacterium veterum]
MTYVIKRNGKKEPFNEQKVKNSVESAVKEAGYKTHAKKRLIDKTLKDVNQAVQGKEEISSAKIRNIVINDLEQEWDEDQVPVTRAWRNYELKHGTIYRE